MKRKDVVIDVTSIEIGWGLAAGHGRKRPSVAPCLIGREEE